MKETPMGMPTKEQETRQAKDWEAVAEAMHLGPIDARPAARIAAGILAGLGTFAILAFSFGTWVWFISLCIRLATRWGWLP